MKLLLDTNVLSETTRPRPSLRVLNWLHGLDEDHAYISVISLGEIRRGIVMMDEGRKRKTLRQWLDHDLIERFAGRILPVGAETALAWGDMTGIARLRGKDPPSIDGLIAATALEHGLTLATRNTKHFEHLCLKLINPWNP